MSYKRIYIVSLSTIMIVVGQIAFAGQAAYMDTAFSFFPQTKYDTSFTRSYSSAFGSAAITNDKRCMINVHSLKPNFIYTVHVDINGSTQGNVSTAGANWKTIGQFTADSNGNGRYNCNNIYSTAGVGSPFSFYINEKTKGLTILISTNLTL